MARVVDTDRRRRAALRPPQPTSTSTAPRFGCGLAQCGACTVIIDGNAHPFVAPCPVSSVGSKDGARRSTGSGPSRKPHPLHRRRSSRAGRAVRLPHERHPDDCEGAARQEPEPERRRHQARARPVAAAAGAMQVIRAIKPRGANSSGARSAEDVPMKSGRLPGHSPGALRRRDLPQGRRAGR